MTSLKEFLRRENGRMPKNIRIQFDWSQRTNAGSLVTWGGFQHLRWLWLGPFYITWEKSS